MSRRQRTQNSAGSLAVASTAYPVVEFWNESCKGGSCCVLDDLFENETASKLVRLIAVQAITDDASGPGENGLGNTQR